VSILILATVLSLAATPARTDIDRLIEQLGDTSKDVRDRAEKRLAGMGEAARETLRRSWKYQDPEVALRSRRLLEKLGPGALHGRIAGLIEKLGDDAFAVRAGAEADLVKIGPEALRQLRAARGHADLETRCRADKAVKRIERGGK
jgi:hypothetical protein